MNRRTFLISTFAAATGLPSASRLIAQTKTLAPDLAALAESNGFQLANRGVTAFADTAKRGARLSVAQGEGLALLSGVEFGDGTITCDLKGKDVAQQSFLGIAFRAADASTYDA